MMAAPSAAWMQAIVEVLGAAMGTCQSSWRLRAGGVTGKSSILSSSAIRSGCIVNALLGTIIVIGEEIGVISIR